MQIATAISGALAALASPPCQADAAFIGALTATADRFERGPAQFGYLANADYTLPRGELPEALVKACEAHRGNPALSKEAALVIDVMIETMPLEGHASRIRDGIYDSRLHLHRPGIPARAKIQAMAWILEALGHRCDVVVAASPRKLRQDFIRLDRIEARPVALS